MREFLREFLASLGLVSARRHKALLQQIEELKAASRQWKNRAGNATARANEFEVALKRQTQLAEKLQLRIDKWRQRQVEVQQLQTQLAATERELMVARDHLMAIEVKLDILEGAANVLDLRTRAAVSRARSETSAPA
jgi:hypothetical protein